MANAGRRGRPIAPLMLTAEERAYLERQIRRHRVARSPIEASSQCAACRPVENGKAVELTQGRLQGAQPKRRGSSPVIGSVRGRPGAR